MKYVAMYLVNSQGRSHKPYTFHTDAEDVTTPGDWIVETQNGLALGSGTHQVEKPDFPTRRAVRLTQEIFEQAQTIESAIKER